jgi:tRNA nucleotidyltransferase (CCA-adding enzyme)
MSCEADARGRTGLENNPYTQTDIFRTALRVATDVDSSEFNNAGLKGPAIGEAINAARLEAIRSATQ